MKTSEHKIYTTKDYSQFKVLEGNRPIKDGRVNKIVDSINRVGYILSPILVNEKMEVIDGQGRLTALERLNMPVDYMIQNGIGINECRQMNIHQSNWTDYDYVCSFAIRGDENYQRLQSLMDSYDVPAAVVIDAALGVAMEGSGGARCEKVRAGTFELDAKNFERAKWELDYACKFKETAKKVGGNKRPFYTAVIYSYRHLDSAGRNRMEAAIRTHAYDLPSLTKAVGYLKYFDGFYNENLSKQRRLKLAVQWELDTM